MPDPLENLTVQKKEPDTSLNPNIENVGVLTDNQPDLKGQNPYHVKKKLLEDNDFFEKKSKEMFLKSFSTNEWQQAKQDPEKLSSTFEEYKKNFRQDLVKSSYAGESYDETLVNRSVDFTSDPKEIPTSDYLDIIQKNKKKYKQFIKDDGSLVYDADDPAFAQKLIQDKDLHKEIEADRYNQFKEELGKYQNTGSFFQSPERLTKGWLVYDKLGKEGLTNYVNALQEDAEGETDQQAQQFINDVKVNDQPLNEYFKEYVTGNVKDLEYGKQIARYSYENNLDPALVASVAQAESNFNPNAESPAGAVGFMQVMPDTAKKDYNVESDQLKDPETSIKIGADYLRRGLKEYDNDLDKALAAYNAGFGNVNKAIKDAKEKGGSWKDYMNKYAKWEEETKGYIERVRSNIPEFQKKVKEGLVFSDRKPRKDLTKNFPKDLNRYTVNFYDKEGKLKDVNSVKDFVEKQAPELKDRGWDFENLKKNGPYSDEYTELTYSIYEKAAKEEGFSMEDLTKTIMANAENGKTEEGRPYYQYDFDKLPKPQQLAHEALQFDSQYSDLFEEVGDGVYRFRPQRREAASEDWKWLKDMMFATETKVQRDSEGNISFKEVPKKDLFSQLRNGVQTLALGGAREALDLFNPIADGVEKLTEATGYGEDWSRELSENVEQLTSINPASDLTTADEDGAYVAGIGEVAPMAWWLASMYGAGKGAIQGISKAGQAITRGKTAMDTIRMGKTAVGSPKFTAMANRLSKGTKNAAPWTTGVGVFYTGGAIREAVTDEDQSFYNVIPEMLGKPKTNSVTKLYNTSGDITQTAMDVGASLAIDLFADTAIAGLRYAKDTSMQKFFNKAPKSMTWIDEGGGKGHYDVADKPQFKHDLREFWHNMTKDLASKPMGEIGDSMAKDFTRGARVESVMDAGKMFSDNFGDVANNIKGEIRQNIDAVQRELGDGVGLSKEQIDEITEREYGRFVQKTGQIMNNIMKQSGDEQLPVRFAQALEEQVPVTKEFSIGGRKIPPEEAGAWRDMGYNVTVKDGKTFVTDSRFWALDLAESIRKNALEPNKQTVVQRKIRELDIDTNNYKEGEAEKVAQISQQAENFIGTPVAVNGRMGHVVDWDDAGYTVRTADGDEVKARVEELSDEQVRRQAERGFNKRIRRFAETEQQARRLDRAGRRTEINKRIDDLVNKQRQMQETQQGMKRLTETQARILSDKELDRFQGNVDMVSSLAAGSEGGRRIADLIGRNVDFGQYEGVLRRDAENNLVVEGRETVAEVPAAKNQDLPASEFGIQPKMLHSPEEDAVMLNDQMLRFKNGMRSFEFDESGEAVSATMIKPNMELTTIKDKNLVDELYNSRVLNKQIDDPVKRHVTDQLKARVEEQNLEMYKNRLNLLTKNQEELTNSQRRIPFC